jgi:hypothetical protein
MNLRMLVLPRCLHAKAERSAGAPIERSWQRAALYGIHQLFGNGVYSPYKYRLQFFDVVCPVWQFGNCVVPMYHTG